MAHETKSLEARIKALEDLEEIRKLKARCLLSSDRKMWDEFGACFTEDAVMDVPPGTHLEGRKEIVESLSSAMSSLVTAHKGLHADITLTSDTTARAIWAMYDHVQNKEANFKMEDYGFYEDEFVKDNGKWKIKKMTRTNFLTEVGKIE